MEKRLLQQRLERYRFFSYLFFTLPNAEFTAKILSLNMCCTADDEGSVLLQKYVDSLQGRDTNVIVTELGADRTQLLRGLTKDGPRPPYESLFVKASPQDIINSLNVTYAESGYAVSKDIHESCEYIGVEINFMQLLCEQELAALDAANEEAVEAALNEQKVFFQKHLGHFAAQVAEEMINFAKTDFFRAVAMLLRDFIQDEAAYLN